MTSTPIKVGDAFFAFDANRRRYDENRRLIYGHHFYEVWIIGETARSWIVGSQCGTEDFRVPKRDPFADNFKEYGVNRRIWTHEMMLDDIWVNVHRHKIRRAFDECRDADKLRRVAEILGYEADA